MVEGHEAMMHYDDEFLSRYIDGELTWSERAGVDEHLSLCIQCREAMAELEFLRGAAAGAPELEPPIRVWQRIQERVGSGARTRTKLRWLLVGMPALAAAVVIVVLAAGRQQVSMQTATDSLELRISDLPVAVDAELPSAETSSSGLVVAGNAGRRRLTQPGGVEKVAPEDVGVESDEAVLAAAVEYRRYLEGLDRAIVESEEAMRSNPGHPRIRLIHAQARASAVVAAEQLIPEGD